MSQVSDTQRAVTIVDVSGIDVDRVGTEAFVFIHLKGWQVCVERNCCRMDNHADLALFLTVRKAMSSSAPMVPSDNGSTKFPDGSGRLSPSLAIQSRRLPLSFIMTPFGSYIVRDGRRLEM